MFLASQAPYPSPGNLKLDHKIVFMPLLIELNCKRNVSRTVLWQCVDTIQPLILNPRSGYKFHTRPEERNSAVFLTPRSSTATKKLHIYRKAFIK